MFFVKGGVYTSTSFTDLEPGTEEEYGPFDSYPEALEVWSARARQQIDICPHRLSIVSDGVTIQPEISVDRFGDRRVFRIDVGDVSDDQAAQLVNRVREALSA